MDLLLDIDLVVDSCVGREPWADLVDRSLDKCVREGGRAWVYAGSVHAMHQGVLQALRESMGADSMGASADASASIDSRARALLKAFTADKHWLAALAGEGPVFDRPDPAQAQMLHALERFAPGAIKLLSRNQSLLASDPERTLSPEAYCAEPLDEPRIGFVDLQSQQDRLRPQLEERIHRILHHGQYILGPEVTELEARLADYTGAAHCITAASGTDALLISLMALGIGPGDEVITTPFTFVATVEVIVLTGAKPVFVDIDPQTCNLDARLLEAKITDNTKAIMPVSLYGQPADMDEINAIAARHGDLPVIEDAAQSFGAEYRGRKSGNLSTLGCTSFFPSKPLGGYGDGGAIFTSDADLAQACREIRVHGQSARYQHGRVGIGGRMDSLQCAVVLANLDRFDQDIARRQAVARRYHQLLDDGADAAQTEHHVSEWGSNASAPGITAAAVDAEQARAQTQPPGCLPVGLSPESGLAPVTGAYRLLPWPTADRTSVFAQYSLLIRDRAATQERLTAAGVPTAVHYPLPMNQQPAYAHHCCPECTPVAAAVAAHIMSLPMHPHLSETDQARIAAALIG